MLQLWVLGISPTRLQAIYATAKRPGQQCFRKTGMAMLSSTYLTECVTWREKATYIIPNHRFVRTELISHTNTRRLTHFEVTVSTSFTLSFIHNDRAYLNNNNQMIVEYS